MKLNFSTLIILIGFISCEKYPEDITKKDLTPGINWIQIKSSSTTLPLNKYGRAILKSVTDFGDDVTKSTSFYYNDILLPDNIFIPQDTGKYSITGIYKDLGAGLEIDVVLPLNKKVLVEYFTSRICGFCPWIGERLDSLQKSNPNVITYSIHGQDEFEVDQTGVFQDYLKVDSRPAVRVNRGFVRNYAAPIEIRPLIDSINYFLSKQAELTLSVESNINGNELDAIINCKYYKKVEEDLFLTLILVEDGITSYNQYNYFSGSSQKNCPYTDKPNPIPEYKNTNILRNFISEPLGDAIVKANFQYGIERRIGSYHIQLENLINRDNCYLIAIVHKRKENINISSVLNSQIVKIGHNVDFEE